MLSLSLPLSSLSLHHNHALNEMKKGRVNRSTGQAEYRKLYLKIFSSSTETIRDNVSHDISRPTRRLGGSNSGSSPGQVVNSWAKSKSGMKDEEKTKPVEGSGQSKQGEKEEGGNVRFGAKPSDVARDLPKKDGEVSTKSTLKVNMSNNHMKT